MKFTTIFAISMLASMSTAANAATFAIDWTGNGGFSMTGLLEFNDSLLNTGVITEDQIDELSINVLQDGQSLGEHSLISDGLGSFASTFNVNFDTDIGQFTQGGTSSGANGQDWFTSVGGGSCETIGFSSGSGGQGICADGSFVGASFDRGNFTLTATALAAVPLPATGLLMIGALGLGAATTRRRRKPAA